MAEKTMRMVAIDKIVIVQELQTRIRVNEDYWRGISKAMGDGSEIPPIHLFLDKEDQLLLGDGAHRVLAAVDQKREKIQAIIHDSSPDTAMSDALLFAIESNGRHGLNWSVEDRKKAVALALKDVSLRRKSDTVLAKLCGCSPALVSRIRENGGKATERKAPAAKKAAAAKKSADKGPTKTGAQQANEELENDSAPAENASAARPERALPIADTNDRRGQMIHQVKAWIDQGMLEWPDIRRILMESDPTREPIMLPKFPINARILEGATNKGMLHIVHIGTIPDGDKHIVELATRPNGN